MSWGSQTSVFPHNLSFKAQIHTCGFWLDFPVWLPQWYATRPCLKKKVWSSGTTFSSPVPVQPNEKMAILVAKSKHLGVVFDFSCPSLPTANSVSATYKTYLFQIQPRLFVIFTALSLSRDTLIRAYLEDCHVSLLVSLLSLCHPPSKWPMLHNALQSVIQKCQPEHISPLFITLRWKIIPIPYLHLQGLSGLDPANLPDLRFMSVFLPATSTFLFLNTTSVLAPKPYLLQGLVLTMFLA